MAVSAFRSTTRRSYQIVSESSAPVVTGSRQGASSQKGTHRRSRSSADSLQKYLSDSEYSGRHGSRYSTQYMSCDSENEVEAGYECRRYQERDCELNDVRDCSSVGAVQNADQRWYGLKRVSSYQNLSSANPSKLSTSVCPDNSRGDHPEDGGEELIKAVYAKMSLKADLFAGNLNTMPDALRVQIRHAIAEIRTEFEQHMKQSCSFRECTKDVSRIDSLDNDAIPGITDIKNEYAAKLKQSERRAYELWCQWAVEESRCLEFSKIVKQLLPVLSRNKSSRRRKVSAEKQLVSKWLDEEAHKYFEDCVSISSLESSELDASYQEEDQCSSKYVKQGVRSEKVSDATYCNEPADKSMVCQTRDSNYFRGSVVENGVDPLSSQWRLPSVAYKKRFMKERLTHSFGKSSDSNKTTQNDIRQSGVSPHLSSKTPDSISGNDSFLSNLNEKEKTVTCITTSMNRAPFTSYGEEESLKHYDKMVAKTSELISGKTLSSAGSKSSKNCKNNKNLSYISVEDQVLERIRLRNRIERGELILCMGIPL